MKKDIKQLFDEYLYECEFVQRLKPKTLHVRRQNFLTFIKLTPEVNLEMLTPITVMKFFKILQERNRFVGKGTIKTGVKKSTVATYWSSLNIFFTWLKVKGTIDQNPFGELKYPTPRYEDRQFLKKEEIEKILTAIITHSSNTLTLKRNLVIFYVLLFCGLRREELLLLQVRDIDLKKRILTIRAETSKVPRTRFLPIHSQLIRSLYDYLNERKRYTTPCLVVSASRDAGLTDAGLKYLLTKLSVVSGVRFHAHQFRHTFAVNFLKSSNNIAKLQQLLGHKSVSMTLQYVRCLPPHEMRRDIEIMSIDNFV